MTWRVRTSRDFEKEYARLPHDVQLAIDQRLLQIVLDPFKTDIRKLSGMTNMYGVRTRTYRLIVDLDLTEQIATVLHVGHRKDVYR